MLSRRALLIASAAVPSVAMAAGAPTALVLGGAGNLGAAIVRRLIARGFEVSVLVRPSTDRKRLDGLNVAYIVGDAADMTAVFAGRKFDVVVDALAGRPGQTNPYATAARNVAAAAKAAGVKHIIFNSSAGAGGKAEDYPDINFARFANGLRDKGDAERIYRETGVPTTIVRSGAILVERATGPHPPTGKAYLTEDVKIVGPTTYDDLGPLVADCALEPRCMGKVFHATDDTLGAGFKTWRCMRFRTSDAETCS